MYRRMARQELNCTQKEDLFMYPDTIEDFSAEVICSDCGERGVFFTHSGNLVPERVVGRFCTFCMKQRITKSFSRPSALRKPLGVQPPGIRKKFRGKKLKVRVMRDNLDFDIYKLTPKGAENEVSIRPEKGKIFLCGGMGDIRVRVLFLEIGKKMFLRSRGDFGFNFAATDGEVISIEIIS